MNRLVIVVALGALGGCPCPSKQPVGPVGGGSGSGMAGSGAPTGAGCDSVRAKIEGLYRAEAQAKEPARVEEAVTDNTAMVMKDCAKDPAKVVACVNGVATVADLEARCVIPLDDEGSEGDASK